MFIGSATFQYPLRSEERNSSRASLLKNQSAPPNGAGGCGSSIHKHLTPTGGNPSSCYLSMRSILPFRHRFLTPSCRSSNIQTV